MTSGSSPKRPRRKAKQPRAHQTVAVVLEAAARILAREGYAAATTNRIAAVAGVSVGTVYEYFSKKEDVFEALIAREIRTLDRAIRSEPLPRDALLVEKLTRLIAAAMAAMRFGPELLRALDHVPGASFRRQLAEARKLVIAHVRDVLEQHRDELRVPDLDLAAFLVVSAAEGVGANASQAMFGEHLAQELQSLVLAYLTGGREPSAAGSTRRIRRPLILR